MQKLLKNNGVTLSGPLPAPMFKVRGTYRWLIILRGEKVNTLHGVAEELLRYFATQKIKARVDVDPMSFM